MKKSDDIVILANGLFPAAQHCLDLLEGAGIIVCCDGAADKLVDFGITPHVIIGDMDSLSESSGRKFAHIIIHRGGQDSNDLTKAVDYCIERKYPSVTILGATGLREDHTLGNISLMASYASGIGVRIISDFGEFFIAKDGEWIPSHAGEKVSIFSTDSSTCVTSEGLRYGLDSLQLSSWHTASLNESSGERFRLHYQSDTPLILYRAR